MVKNIENTKIEVNMLEEKFELPKEIQSKIHEFWKDAQTKTPDLWDGELMCVSSYERNGDMINITCKKTTYSHYLYNERIGLPMEYRCNSLASGCILETRDDYYIIGEMAENTSFPKGLQPCGGSVEKKDKENGKINVLKTIERESKEELNLNMQDKEQVISNNIKLISLPTDIINTYMIFTKCKLNMNKSEMEEHYQKYLKTLKEKNDEVEFSKIHFIKKQNVREQLEKFKNPKRKYLLELLEVDSNS